MFSRADVKSHVPSGNSLLALAHSVDGIILILGPDGTIRTMSASDGAPLRTYRTQFLGRRLNEVVGERAFLLFKELFEHVAKTGKGQTVEFAAHLDGGEHLFRVRCAAALESGDDAQSMCLRISGVTESSHADEKLLISEALMARAEQLADVGSWEYDVERRDFRWSEHFFRMLGVEPRESKVSVQEACPLVHPEDRGTLWNDVAKLVATGEPLDNEVRFVKPDGSVRTFHSRTVPVKDLSGGVVKFAGLSQDVTEHKRSENALRVLSRRLLNLRDSERRRTARVLHETAVQTLAALKMRLAQLGEALTDKESPTYALYQSSCVLIDDATNEVRTVAYLMHPPTLDIAGLESALRWFAKGFAQRSQIATKVDVAEGFGRLPQEIEITIFRVVQEALTNVHRHSRSRSAEIRLSRDAQFAVCEVEDHGVGMPPVSANPNAPHARFGVGIAGMQERVQQLKGTFEILSTPENGTTVRVTIPIDQETRQEA
jgi:PAS domain S-box-containing protein